MGDVHVFGWRDRAVAMAALGAAALGRSVFPAEPGGLRPLQMQVLIALALHESVVVDPPARSGSSWLGLALNVDPEVVEVIVSDLETAGLARRSSRMEDLGEIRYELAEEDDSDAILGEIPISLTDAGAAAVDHWLALARRRFGGWPHATTDVDDAVG